MFHRQLYSVQILKDRASDRQKKGNYAAKMVHYAANYAIILKLI